MNISFMTFASSDWVKSPIRFNNDLKIIQEKYNFFDRSLIWNEKNLGEWYENRFSKYYSDHGFAYFSWKPYSLEKALNLTSKGDYLFYIDSGCVLPMDDIEDFLESIKTTINEIEKTNTYIGITTYIDRNPRIKNIPNACIIKNEILQDFDLLYDNNLKFSYPHYQAGIFLLKNDDRTFRFLRQWNEYYNNSYEKSVRGGYTDRVGQSQCFIHNGSDQAIMQCIIYKNKINTTLMNWIYKFNLIQHRMG